MGFSPVATLVQISMVGPARGGNSTSNLGPLCEVIAIRLAGGRDHEHVGGVRVIDATTSALVEVSRSDFIAWLSQPGHRATVRSGLRVFDVQIVAGAHAYVRARSPDGWTDQLLGLPRF